VNPDRSVCELGSMIGRMWRELGDTEKQPYFDSFTNAKVRVPYAMQCRAHALSKNFRFKTP